MGIAARLFGLPVVVAALAVAAFGAHTTQPSETHSKRTTKPHPARAPKSRIHRPSRVSSNGAARTIAGTWYVANGIFEFRRAAAENTFTDVVISQRPGVFCPRVNDQNGQMVLHHAHGRVYVGTWAWYYVNTCKFAGYGQLTVTLWWDGHRATFVAESPEGLPGSSHTFLITRLS